MKYYTVLEASEILGMEKMSLHSIIRSGLLKTKKKTVNGVPTLFISAEELRKYADKKKERLVTSLQRMNLDKLEEEE